MKTSTKTQPDFFDGIRHTLFGGKLKQSHVNGIKALLAAFDRHGITDRKQRAYMLATAKWETAHTMKPIAEYGRGRGRKYGKADAATGKAYYGRGFVQLTWKSNYMKMGRLLGMDLVNKPHLAMHPDTAADILVIGMRDGMFAPAAGPLSRYLGPKNNNWEGARRTVNGKDKKAEIAAIARKFHIALAASPAKPEPPPQPEQQTIFSRLWAVFLMLTNWWRNR